jgi:hypothetical protein
MIKGTVTITSKSKVKEVTKSLQLVDGMQVFVGIPEDTTERKDGEMTNAALCYIHTNGSQLHNLPARPIIEPAINAPGNVEPITEEMKQAIEQMVFRGNELQAFTHLKRAGMLGQNAARGWFTDPRNNWAPNKPSTVLGKVSKLSGKKKAKVIDAIASGASLSDMDTPLIDTGQLRKSIIYVVKVKGSLQESGDEGDK